MAAIGAMTRSTALKAYRENAELSQTAMARKLGVSRSYLHRLETGQRRPGPRLLPKIRRLTGLSGEELRSDLIAALGT
jgi:transcriptional regulator with XRE-family HTH domain